MDLGIAGRVALVMAGRDGIGLATAHKLHAEGASVAICARNTERLNAAAATMPGVWTASCDVTDPDQIDRTVNAVLAELGPVEILINNAGGPKAGPIEAMSDNDWQLAVNLTLMSAVRTTRLALPGMRAKRWGRIVNISSYGVKQPVPGLSLSNSVRMAVLGWAKTLAEQVAADNILVNTVCPGWTRTTRVTQLVADRAHAAGNSAQAITDEIARTIPLGRIGEADEIANVAVFLASGAASYVTGTAIQVDGGLVRGYA